MDAEQLDHFLLRLWMVLPEPCVYNLNELELLIIDIYHSGYTDGFRTGAQLQRLSNLLKWSESTNTTAGEQRVRDANDWVSS